jgi:tricorn protease
MRHTLRSLLALLFVAILAGSTPAQEPIRFARMPDISPDGKLVAFSYLGDIWVVETIGGVARPVTVHRAHDIDPVFSPDGKTLAFSSNRHGSYDVYTIPVTSGKPTRLTFDSSNNFVNSWSPDGKTVLFTSNRSTAFPSGPELYSVPADGGMTYRVSAAEGKDGVYSPNGQQFAYVRGPGLWYRKGYRGSSNDDVWIANADGSNNRRLTDFNGQDNSPMWSADGQSIYYVSEQFGTPANILRLPANASPGDKNVKPVQITFHKDEAVRRARISANGAWIVYECGPDLWVVGAKEGSQPRKLAIEVHTDDKSNTERQETFTSNATEFALSADEKFVAFAVHGELFMMPVSPNAKVTRLTNTTASNHGIAWAPDNSKILYISDQSGHDNIWALQSAEPDKAKLVDGQKFKSTQLTRTTDATTGLSFAPDGKRVAFVQGGKLHTMNPDGGDQKVLVNEGQVIDYEWSPDSKWLVYSRMDGSFASELYIVPATGPTQDNPARNVTHYATYNNDVTWSLDGKQIAFLSERRSKYPTLHIMSLEKPAAPGVPDKPVVGPPNVEIDWDDLHLRVNQVNTIPMEEVAIAPDGGKVAFKGTNNGQTDLWVVSTDGRQMTRLTTGGLLPARSSANLQWTKRLARLGGPSTVIYFRDKNGQIRAASLSSPANASNTATPNDNIATLSFKVKMTIKTDEEFTEMFDQAWRYLSENFYDNKFHGTDWDAVRSKYRPLVHHVTMKEDLYDMLYLMMGELNASHLGVGSQLTVPEERTADLGLIYDESYRGRGLKIKEILKRGPADVRGLNLKPGDLIVAIDGEEITPKTDVSKLLNDKENETVALTITTIPDADPKDPKARRLVHIQATERRKVAKLMYERWVDNNAKRVAELSNGKLGYIHIPSMDDDGLDAFVRSLYSENFDKEAIVLDVRFNGGGFTHDQVLNYLGAKGHTFFKQRDGGEGFVLRSTDRKWTKPLVLLINNRSYSDAEIFPDAFKTLNLGKVVGQPTGGYVIGTGSVSLIDGSRFAIPRIGVYTTKGVNMEKEGVLPDVLVEPHPDQLAKGIDVQLEKAVEVLRNDVVEWKKTHPDVPVKSEQPPVVAPAPPK